MSYVVAITFDNAEEAEKVSETLSKGQKGGYISLDDSAVIVMDEEGKAHVKNEMDRGTKVGAVGGGFLGLLIGGLMFPVVGLVIGVVGGALVGKLAAPGIDKKFVEDVEKDLTPGTSAIIFIVRDANVDYAMASLRPYKGKVYQTSLPEESEEELRKELKKHIT
jgi:uncharacterized membrane protein